MTNEELKIQKDKEYSELYANEMQNISQEHAELTRTTRIRLERDNEDLQVELEVLKANVLLNSDKLDYNFQVLKKREEENIMVRNQQKRRLSRLNETIDNLKLKIKDLKQHSSVETFKLTEDIFKWRRKIFELEEKSVAMTEHNDHKYNCIWKMNYDICLKLLDKVLMIDRILYEQQLGLNWDNTFPELIKKEDLSSFKKKLNGAKINSREKSSKENRSSNTNTNSLNTILGGIIDRGEFLVEKKVLELLKPFSENQKNLVKIDNIFQALNITRFENISELHRHFMKYAFCLICRSNYEDKSNRKAGDKTPNIPDNENFEQDKFEDSHSDKNILAAVKKEGIDDVGIESTGKKCVNHEYVIEPSSVLESLKSYMQNYVTQNKTV